MQTIDDNDVRVLDALRDAEGAPLLVPSARWHGGIADINTSTDARVFSLCVRANRNDVFYMQAATQAEYSEDQFQTWCASFALMGVWERFPNATADAWCYVRQRDNET